MFLQPVEELGISIWKDFWKIVVVSIDENMLKTLQLWFWNLAVVKSCSREWKSGTFT